jgi:hypothetical protein
MARQHACNGVGQAFGERHLAIGQAGITPVAVFAARVVGAQCRRLRAVAAAPDQHLRVTVLQRGLGLVQALQRAVVTFVQAPVADHRQPGAVEFVEAVPKRPDRALEHRGVGQVEVETRFAQQLPGLPCLRHAGVG